MTTHDEDYGGEDPRIAEAVAAFLEAQDAGKTPNPASWADSYPDAIQPALREVLRGLVGVGHGSPGTAMPAARLPPPRTLPKFGNHANLELIGIGGMGAVYRADHSTLAREVAVKVLHPEFAGNPSQCDRFLQEARIASRLQHPNIVPVYEYGTIPGSPPRPFFTMRRVKGRTFHEVVKAAQTNPTTRDDLLRAFLKICDAVAYAHSLEVLHRDLKPQNVMVGDFGEVLVMDWGLSRSQKDGEKNAKAEPKTEATLASSSESTAPFQTRAGAIVGTPSYMPPEQANGATVGKPADVFALGGLLAFLFTGRPVYEGDSVTATLAHARSAKTGAALERMASAKAPAELVAIVRRCLEKNADDRFPSAQPVADAVRAYLAKLEAAKLRAERRAKWAVAALAAIIVVAVAAVSGWLLYRQQERQREETARIESERAAEQEQTRLDGEARDLKEREKALALANEELRKRAAQTVDVNAAIADMYAAIDRDRFDLAVASLKGAKGRLGSDSPAELAAKTAESEKLYDAALNLDDIRQERVYLDVDPKYSSDPAIEKYAKQFAALGCDPTQPGAAERIRTSPIRRSLVAALDDWAASTSDPERLRVFLAVARAADPDPEWGDKVRDPVVRADPAKLIALAAGADLNRLNVGQVEVLLKALPPADPTGWRLLQQAERRHPNDFWVQLATAGHLARNTKGKSAEQVRLNRRDAIGYAHAALALRPDSLGAMGVIGQLLFSDNRADELVSLAERAERVGRESWTKSVILAHAAIARREYRVAIEHLKHAIELEPSNRSSKITLGGLYTYLRESDKAIEIFDSVLALSPNHPMALAGKAEAMLLAARTNDAEKLCRAALVADPENALGRTVLTAVLIRRGRFLDAERLLQTIEVSDPGARHADVQRFALHLIRGDTEAALRLYESSSLIHDYISAVLYVVVLAEAGRHDDARKQYAAFRQTIRDNNIDLAASIGFLGFFADLQLWRVENTLKMFSGFDDDYAKNGTRFTDQDFKDVERLTPLISLQVADYMLTKKWLHTAARIYEIALPPNSNFGSKASLTAVLLCCNRVNAARAATQAWIGAGRDSLKSTDADRARFLKFALRCLRDEVEYNLKVIEDDGNLRIANWRLHFLKMHRDLEPLRNPENIRELPAEERKQVEKLWADVDAGLAKLNPPLDLPWLEKK